MQAYFLYTSHAWYVCLENVTMGFSLCSSRPKFVVFWVVVSVSVSSCVVISGGASNKSPFEIGNGWKMGTIGSASTGDV